MKLSGKKQLVALAGLIGFLAGNSTALANTIASISDSYASYVVLGQAANGKNIAIARTIIDEAILCPAIIASSEQKSIAMVPRENHNHFSVVVCEALVEFDKEYQISFSDGVFKLPSVSSSPQNIQVYGDSGCKSSKPGKPGCARGKAAEPFKSLADAGASDKPDLVLHMGDYNYRGTSGDVYFTQKNSQGSFQQNKQWPYDAGDGSSAGEQCEQGKGTRFYSQSAVNSNYPDIWRNWHDDLFKPAKKLLAQAPWIVARGNHELCSRAGAGYFYFLDPHSNLIEGSSQLSCPELDVSKSALMNTRQIPTYKVALSNLDILVIDSANACDSFSDSPFTPVYEKVFEQVSQLVSDKPAWLMGHRPIWGVTKYYPDESTGCGNKNKLGCVNKMMQKAIAGLAGNKLPDAIKLILAGHMHRFQSVSFDNKRPPVLVIGTSGVELDSSSPDGALTATIDGLNATVLTTNNQLQRKKTSYDAFGYFQIKLDQSANWTGDLINPAEGLTIAKCSSKQDKAQGVCEFAKNISVD